MKKYTSFTDDYPVVTGDHCWEDQNENYCGPAIDRLAEYEATNLMPAEVAALQYQLRAKDANENVVPEVVCDRFIRDQDELSWLHQFRFRIGGKEWAVAKKIPENVHIRPWDWIPVTERLPRRENAMYGQVLAVWKDSGAVGAFPWNIVHNFPDSFLHWMPLPQPPKEVE